MQTTQDKSKRLRANQYQPVYSTFFPMGNRQRPPQVVRVTVNGSYFGAGPHIELFDQFIGRHGDNALRTPERGAWNGVSSYGDGMPKLFYDPYTERTWFSSRNIDRLAAPEKNLQALFKRFPASAKFRFSTRIWVPPSHCFPGELTPMKMPLNSTWKMIWMGQDNGSTSLLGRDAPYRNVCIPTQIGNGAISVGGNNNGPSYFANYERALYGHFSFESPTLYSYYQDGAGTKEQYDTPVEFLAVNKGRSTRVMQLCDPFASHLSDAAFTTRSYNAFTYTGWYGSAPGDNYTNVLPLMNDCYLAVGDNSRAMIVVSGSPVYPSASATYQAVHVIWTNDQIVFDIDQHIIDDLGEHFFVHLVLADDTLIQNVDYSTRIL